MSDDKKLEACARAAYEANRACMEITGVHQLPWWDDTPFGGLPESLRRAMEQDAAEILAGKLSVDRNVLFTTVVRIVAAELGMRVTYPGVPENSETGAPEIPENTVDFSDPQTRKLFGLQ